MAVSTSMKWCHWHDSVKLDSVEARRFPWVGRAGGLRPAPLRLPGTHLLWLDKRAVLVLRLEVHLASHSAVVLADWASQLYADPDASLGVEILQAAPKPPSAVAAPGPKSRKHCTCRGTHRSPNEEHFAFVAALNQDITANAQGDAVGSSYTCRHFSVAAERAVPNRKQLQCAALLARWVQASSAGRRPGMAHLLHQCSCCVGSARRSEKCFGRLALTRGGLRHAPNAEFGCRRGSRGSAWTSEATRRRSPNAFCAPPVRC